MGFNTSATFCFQVFNEMLGGGGGGKEGGEFLCRSQKIHNATPLRETAFYPFLGMIFSSLLSLPYRLKFVSFELHFSITCKPVHVPVKNGLNIQFLIKSARWQIIKAQKWNAHREATSNLRIYANVTSMADTWWAILETTDLRTMWRHDGHFSGTSSSSGATGRQSSTTRDMTRLSFSASCREWNRQRAFPQSHRLWRRLYATRQILVKRSTNYCERDVFIGNGGMYVFLHPK